MSGATKKSPTLDRAVTWLKTELGDGLSYGSNVKLAAGAAGIKPRTLQRAAAALRIRKERCARNDFFWSLPPPTYDEVLALLAKYPT